MRAARSTAKAHPTRPVYITRRFPPSVGGQETLAATVWRTLSSAAPDSVLVAHTRAGRGFLTWLPRALTRMTWLIAFRRVDLVLTGDAVMQVTAWPLLRLLRSPSASMVHGLDLTYRNRAYQAIVPRALRHASVVIANSAATAGVLRELGVDPARIRVVHPAIEAPDVDPPRRARARSQLNLQLELATGDVVLLTLGRLVRRKGVVWFVTNVLPRLPDNTTYVVAGTGEEESRVRAAVGELGLEKRVRLLGGVSDELREVLLLGADLFVQPNIPVRDDMEGFGLVAVEAATRGLFVIASELEGLAEAVVDGRTGLLLPPGDATAWVEALVRLTNDRAALARMGREAQEMARRRSVEEMGGELLRALCVGPV